MFRPDPFMPPVVGLLAIGRPPSCGDTTAPAPAPTAACAACVHLVDTSSTASSGTRRRIGNNVWGRAAYPPLWQNHQSLEFRLVKLALGGIRDRCAAPEMDA